MLGPISFKAPFLILLFLLRK